jgi:glutamate carboxypeptidase
MTLTPYQPQLDWIAQQQAAMIALTEQWANINSGSYNLAGLRTMRTALGEAFAPLGGVAEVIALAPITQINAAGEAVEVPMAEALRITKRPEAKTQILLVGHMDTVYGIDHPFQKTRKLSDNIVNGPGVADLKGGLAVMLYALMALERSPYAANLGWQVLLNPDEEIGSAASDPLLKEAAQGKTLGLVYEPALADGTLAGARKGSGNFTLVVRGRAAHAGRNPEEGRNAIAALADLTSQIFALNGQRQGVTLNPGKIEGGGALNVVPDLAILRFNIRTREVADEAWVMGELEGILERSGFTPTSRHPGESRDLRPHNLRLSTLPEIPAFAGMTDSRMDGFTAALHGHFTRKPKPISPEIQRVFDLVQSAGRELGITLGVRPSGGCCDGNNLWHHGLPNVDTLGVRGANIHSDQEIAYLDSFTERAQLSALILMKLIVTESK